MFVLVPLECGDDRAAVLWETSADRRVPAIAGGYRRRSARILLPTTQHCTRADPR